MVAFRKIAPRDAIFKEVEKTLAVRLNPASRALLGVTNWALAQADKRGSNQAETAARVLVRAISPRLVPPFDERDAVVSAHEAVDDLARRARSDAINQKKQGGAIADGVQRLGYSTLLEALSAFVALRTSILRALAAKAVARGKGAVARDIISREIPRFAIRIKPDTLGNQLTQNAQKIARQLARWEAVVGQLGDTNLAVRVANLDRSALDELLPEQRNTLDAVRDWPKSERELADLLEQSDQFEALLF